VPASANSEENGEPGHVRSGKPDRR